MYAWTILQFPGTSVALTISPLFHLLPLTVLIVLFSAWIYLTRIYAQSLATVERRKPTAPPSRRELERRRLKGMRRFSRGINRRFQKIGHSIKAAFLKIPGMTGASKRLSFARASVRSAVTVFAVFISVSFLLFVIVYPDLIRNIVVGFYQADSSRVNFVRGVGNGLQGFGGGVGTAIAEGLWAAAPGFRQSLSGVGASLTGGIVHYTGDGKYVLSQNVAALAVIGIALLYGWFTSIQRPRKR